MQILMAGVAGYKRRRILLALTWQRKRGLLLMLLEVLLLLVPSINYVYTNERGSLLKAGNIGNRSCLSIISSSPFDLEKRPQSSRARLPKASKNITPLSSLSLHPKDDPRGNSAGRCVQDIDVGVPRFLLFISILYDGLGGLWVRIEHLVAR